MGIGSDPSSPASHPAPCLWPGKAVGESPTPWDPAAEWETWKRLLAPGLRIGTAPAIAAAWGVNYWVKNCPLSIAAFPIKTNKFLKKI